MKKDIKIIFLTIIIVFITLLAVGFLRKTFGPVTGQFCGGGFSLISDNQELLNEVVKECDLIEKKLEWEIDIRKSGCSTPHPYPLVSEYVSDPEVRNITIDYTEDPPIAIVSSFISSCGPKIKEKIIKELKKSEQTRADLRFFKDKKGKLLLYDDWTV
ncbi:hypothetical protein ACFL0W_04430 [Nanoarchaeota archaeon]